jgi:NAD(P)-dependent dehydrogenase (short-subunit alcohol dehydrogenase family)
MPSSTIVITGCTRGCGLALADYLSSQGHTVIGCGRSPSTAAHVADYTKQDITGEGGVAAWAKRVTEKFGAPDLLVNNAAVIARNAPLWEVPTSELIGVLDINIRGTINVIRGFAPAMIKRGRGVIVNYSSGWGRSTSPEVAAYCASKWAIEGLSRALAQELEGSGVSAVALNPGIIDTEMLRSCFGKSAAAYPSPEQWAKSAAPFLLSLGKKHNGQSLDVPGIPVD